MKNRKSNKYFNIYNLPIIIMSSIVPIIMMIKLYDVPIDVESVKQSSDYIYDIYHYYKMIVLSFTGFFMSLLLIKELALNRIHFINFIKKHRMLYISITLITLLTISTLKSNYSSVVFLGFPERFEGFFAIYTYYISTIYITYFISKKNIPIRSIILPLLCSGIFVSAFGLFEYFGVYLVEQSWFSSAMGILLPSSVPKPLIIKYIFAPNTLASTLYNPNYVGSYMAMLTFIAIGFILTNRDNDKDKKLLTLALVSTILFFLALVFSNSATGLLGIAGGCIVLIFFILLKNNKRKTATILFILCSVLTLTITIDEVKDDSPGLLRSKLTSFNQFDESSSDYLYKDFSIKNNTLSITFKELTIHMFYNISDQSLSLTDNNDNKLTYTLNDISGNYVLDDPLYNDFHLTMTDQNNHIIFNVGLLKLDILLTLNTLGYLDFYGDFITETSKIDSIGFKGNEQFATNRGFLWSRSLPIIRDNIIFGIGPDAFAMEFPQDDIIGKINFSEGYNTFVDKPHNYYLQVAINQGIPSVLIILILIFTLGFKLTKDLISPIKEVPISRITIYCSIISYMISGISIDSTVGIGPVFWTLVGLSIHYTYDDSLQS